jgi:protein-tyrosine phosphatase
LSFLRARSVQQSDFAGFDWVLAMENGHLRDLQWQCPPEYQSRVKIFLSFAPTPA